MVEQNVRNVTTTFYDSEAQVIAKYPPAAANIEYLRGHAHGGVRAPSGHASAEPRLLRPRGSGAHQEVPTPRKRPEKSEAHVDASPDVEDWRRRPTVEAH